MRKNRAELYLFNLTIHLIDKLEVQLPFRNQFISDALFRTDTTLIMTKQEVRIYQKGQPTDDHPSRVFTSVRKGETFRKVFVEDGQELQDMLLVLQKEEDVCIRTFRESKKGIDLCLFKTQENIKSIHKATDFLLI